MTALRGGRGPDGAARTAAINRRTDDAPADEFIESRRRHERAEVRVDRQEIGEYAAMCCKIRHRGERLVERDSRAVSPKSADDATTIIALYGAIRCAIRGGCYFIMRSKSRQPTRVVSSVVPPASYRCRTGWSDDARCFSRVGACALTAEAAPAIALDQRRRSAPVCTPGSPACPWTAREDSAGIPSRRRSRLAVVVPRLFLSPSRSH